MSTGKPTPKARKPKTNNYVGILEQFLKKHNLTADSTPEQLSKHAPELDALLPDWMARRNVKVALVNGTKNRRSFSKEKIEALLPLVLLDLKMPLVGGLEVLSAMRGDDRLRSLPVIVVTTSNMPRDVREAYARGVNAYLTKPVDLKGLRAMVSALKHFWLDLVILPDTSLA
jgi:CheY-like chemotaxis protein